jgi:hypothetical protein
MPFDMPRLGHLSFSTKYHVFYKSQKNWPDFLKFYYFKSKKGLRNNNYVRVGFALAWLPA